MKFTPKFNLTQVIQFVTFLSPNVGGHQQPLSSGHVFTIPKGSQRIVRQMFYSSQFYNFESSRSSEIAANCSREFGDSPRSFLHISVSLKIKGFPISLERNGSFVKGKYWKIRVFFNFVTCRTKKRSELCSFFRMVKKI